jgi:PD-(D/E)XK nuclease superfamily
VGDRLYTASRLRVIRQCMRMHHYRYDIGIRSPETDVMRFGTVGHLALEAYYRAWMAGDLDGRLSSALDAIVGVHHVDAVKLRVLVTAYHHRWGAEDWDVLAVEQEFRFMLGAHEIGGKIDAIVRDRRGLIYVVEHKTTGTDASVGSPYWERLTIDTQVSIYIDGASMLGYDVAGCVYDVIKRPAHEPKLMTPYETRKYTAGKGCKACGGSAGGKAGIVQGNGYYTTALSDRTVANKCPICLGSGWKPDADGRPQSPRLHAHLRDADETPEEFESRLVDVIAENPDAFLLRGKVVRLDHELPGMRQDMIDDIERAELGLTPRNPDACVRGGVMCGYFGLCSGTADINTFPRGPVHPELAERGQ